MSALDPEAIAAHVAACPGVVALSAGPSGTIATYLPGRRIVGVRTQEARVEIHVIGQWDVPVPTLAADIRASLVPFVDARDIDISVDDLSEPAAGPARTETNP
jgi:hypothetical protein